MKILYLDFLYPKGHLNLDKNHINILSKIGDVSVISPSGRYSNLPEGVNLIEKDSIFIYEGRVSNRLSSLKAMLVSSIETRKIKPDRIIVSAFETIVFAIGRLFFCRRNNLIVIHHFNTDELKNSFKRFCFKTYMKKVIHIVFGDFIKEYLIENFDINPNSIYVLPHHMNILKITSHSNKYDCVGLSNSNDERLISEIIKIEKETQILANAQKQVILKSKNFEYDDGFLKVIKGFLDKKVYDEYINNCICIYLPFPKEFRYRMSGTLIDALSNNKVVLGSDILAIRHYSNNYPTICKVTDNAKDFLNYLISTKSQDDYKLKDDFIKFRKDHSEKQIEDTFIEIITNNNSL